MTYLGLDGESIKVRCDTRNDYIISRILASFKFNPQTKLHLKQNREGGLEVRVREDVPFLLIERSDGTLKISFAPDAESDPDYLHLLGQMLTYPDLTPDRARGRNT